MAKKRKRVAWSAEHVRTLKSMAKRKSTASKIAKALKRTEGATRQKAFSIGLSLDSRALRYRAFQFSDNEAPPFVRGLLSFIS